MRIAAQGRIARQTYRTYNKFVDIEFDPAKDAANREKHGVALSEAESLEWDTLVSEPDSRHKYGEERFVGYALRIMSLRKANQREVKRYADKN